MRAHDDPGTLLMHVPGVLYRAGFEATRVFVYVSAGACELLGEGPDELLRDPRRWRKRVHPHDVADVEQALRAAYEGRHDVSLVYRVVYPSGGVRWVLDRAQLVKDASGKPIAYEGLITDISSLRRDEESLRDSERRFRTLFEEATVGLAYVDILGRGRWLRVNDRVCQITGYSRDELLGMTFQDITHPDDLAEDLFQCRRMARGEIESYSLEKRYIRKNGASVWVALTASVVRKSSGEIDFAFSVIEDIHDKKLAQEAWRKNEERLRLAQLAGDMGVFDWDLVSNRAQCSDAFFRIIGRKPTRSGMVAFERELRWIYPDDRERTLRELDAALASGATDLGLELRALGEDDVARWIFFKGEIRRDVRGRAVRLIGAVRDISTHKRAEEQVREAYGRLSLALQVAQAGMWDWRVREGPVAFVSPEYRDLYGLGPDEPVSYERWLGLIHPNDRARVEAYGREFFAHGREYSVDFRIEHPTRGLRWLGSNGFLYRDAQGRPERFIGINLDITAIRMAKQALHESEERFRKIYENAATGIAITRWDGQFEQCNAAYSKLTGYSQEELKSLDFARLVHPEDRDENIALVRRLRVGEMRSFEIENRYVRKDGEPVWVHKFVSLLGDPSGKPARLLALVTDITARRREQRELRASEERLRSVIDSMFAFVAVLSPDGTLTETNRAPLEVLGLSRPDVIGKKYWDCPWWSYDSRVQARLRDAFGRALRGEVVRYDESIATARGGRMEIDFMLQPVSSGDGLRFVISSAVDITDRKRAEEALRESDQRKDEFLATLAHELRNPLAPLRTGTEVLKLATDETTRERVREMMERQLAHMVRLIDDLLDVSRISRGKFELKREIIPLDVAISHAVETSRSIVEAGKNTLDVHMPTTPVWVNGDLTRLAQVVSNLLNNSAKYTPPGGHIDVGVAVEQGDAVVRVRDTGIGIAPETLPNVFDLFAQAGRNLGRAQGGLGIGLSLVRKLVEMHGGDVSAESPGLGCGSTFTVRLPLAAPVKTSAATSSPVAKQGKRRRVLVVDDNKDAADLLATVLERRGYETRAAHDGPSALDVATTFRPEIVFLDIGLPGMSGHEVAQRLRKEPALSDTMLVALTGWGGQQDKRRTSEAGFHEHLTKPVDVATVQDVLSRYDESHP